MMSQEVNWRQAYFKIFERGRSFNDEMFFVRMYLNRFAAAKPLEHRVKTFLAHLFERRRILAKETNLMEKLPDAGCPSGPGVLCTRSRQKGHLEDPPVSALPLLGSLSPLCVSSCPVCSLIVLAAAYLKASVVRC